MTTTAGLALCIGAPRCGTSWLYRALRGRRGLFVPPVKELRYLLGQRSIEEQAALAERRGGSGRRRRRAPDEQRWFERWAALRCGDDAGYLDLTARWHPGARGVDISPIYCTASAAQIGDFRARLPEDTRIVLLLRDPVARTASHLRLILRGPRGRATLPPTLETCARVLRSPEMLARSDYAAMIERWGRAFGRENLAVDFHARLTSDPAGLLADLLMFLGASDEGAIDAAALGEPVNASAGWSAAALPDGVMPLVAVSQLPALVAFARVRPDPGEAWLARAEAIARVERGDETR